MMLIPYSRGVTLHPAKAREERSRYLPQLCGDEAPGRRVGQRSHSIAEQRTITQGRVVPVEGIHPQAAEARRLLRYIEEREVHHATQPRAQSG
jgi:hypothetical protein